MFAMFLRFGNNFSTYCNSTTIARHVNKRRKVLSPAVAQVLPPTVYTIYAVENV